MIQNPVFIIGCPRSGTTLLYNMLSEVPTLWSIGTESKHIIEKHHHPREKEWSSGALDGSDVTRESREYILDAFARQAAPGTFWQKVNRLRRWLRQRRSWQRFKQQGRTEQAGSAVSSSVTQQSMDRVRQLVAMRNRLVPRGARAIRLLEKTPENCLRLPFLQELFPDGRIIFLVRDGRNNVNSLLNGWREPHLFPGYRVPIPLNVPGYHRQRWAFTLIPGWKTLTGRPLAEICAHQWLACNQAVLEYLNQAPLPVLTLRYEDLITQPGTQLARIATFLELDYAKNLAHFATGLPQINVTSQPTQDKWLQNEADIRPVLPLLTPLLETLGYESNR